MELKICYLYYDILNACGDRGNVLILKNVLNWCGIDCSIEYLTIGDKFNYSDCDILFMGSGDDAALDSVCQDIRDIKLDDLKNYIELGGTGLLICGAFQVLGESLQLNNGEYIKGAGIFDIYTEKSPSRLTGDLIVKSDFFKSFLAGFESHMGRIYIKDYTPLGRVEYGFGNNGKDGSEGMIYNNILCTNMHGCCLSRNPEMVRFLISSAIMRKYRVHFDVAVDEFFMLKSKDYMMRKYKYPIG